MLSLIRAQAPLCVDVLSLHAVRFTAARLADMHALNELDAKAYSFFR